MPEQPIGGTSPEPLRSSGVRLRPLAVFLTGVLLLFFCALLWLTVASRSIASRSKIDARNTPDALLAGNVFDSLTNLPQLAEPTTNLAAVDLAFGEEQIARMVKD